MDNLIKKIIARMEGFDDDIKDDAVRLRKLKTAWENGRDAWNYKCETGTAIKEIARQCGIIEGTLQRFVRFYRLYSKGYTDHISGKPLMWGHYMALVYLRDAKARQWYLRQAAANGWSTQEIRRRVREGFYENSQPAAGARTDKRRLLDSMDQDLYTYSAKVLKVVDADTLKVEVDVGFSMRFETKVRLRGINAAEKGTKKGEEAKRFVEDELGADGPGAPVIVIRSYKSGKFGRFIADVWYLKGETDPEVILKKGKFLNQVLLDRGLAEKM